MTRMGSMTDPHEQTAEIEQAIYNVAVDHGMWIGDDGEPLDYLPEREARIGEFVREATRAVLAATSNPPIKTEAAA